MKRLLLGFLASVIAVAALAAGTNGTPTANVSWTAPTAYVDGSAMPSTDILNYTVSWVGTNGISHSSTVTALTAVVNALCGTVNFSVTVTTTATALYPNATSSPAGPVPFVSSISCVPSAPGGLAVH